MMATQASMEAIVQSDVLEKATQAHMESDTTLGGDKAMIQTHDSEIATQVTSIPYLGSATTQEEMYFMCPVCLQLVGSILSMANDNQP